MGISKRSEYGVTKAYQSCELTMWIGCFLPPEGRIGTDPIWGFNAGAVGGVDVELGPVDMDELPTFCVPNVRLDPTVDGRASPSWPLLRSAPAGEQPVRWDCNASHSHAILDM